MCKRFGFSVPTEACRAPPPFSVQVKPHLTPLSPPHAPRWGVREDGEGQVPGPACGREGARVRCERGALLGMRGWHVGSGECAWNTSVQCACVGGVCKASARALCVM